MLLKLINSHPSFPKVYESLTKDGNIVHGLTNSAKSTLLAALLEKSTVPIIFLVQNHHEAQVYYREIKNLCSERPCFNFLAQEVSPYDQINSDIGVLSSQYEIFESWFSGEVSLTVINIKAFMQLYINREEYLCSKINLKKDLEINPQELLKKLTLLGYRHESMVENRGEFSLRGDILDIYPLLGDPVRIEFWGDNIESLRTFNTSSQRSIQSIDSLTVQARYQLVRKPNDNLGERLQVICKEHNIEDLINTEGDYWEGIEYYRGLLGQEPSSIFEFINSNTHLVFDEWQDLLNLSNDWQKKQEETYQEGIKTSKLIPIINPLHLDSATLTRQIQKFPKRLYLQTIVESVDSSPHADKIKHSNIISEEITSYPAERFASKIEDFVAYIRNKIKDSERIIIYSEQPQRVLGILREWDIQGLYQADLNIPANATAQVFVERDGLEEGCKIPIFKLIVLTDRELFGRSRQAVARQKNANKEAKTKRDIYTDIAELNSGDYVVHYKHGVGIYRGTEYISLDAGRIRSEYLAIEYADEARILIPVDQVNLLSRFNVNQEMKPRLSKLGGTEWERVKSKVKKSVKRIAEDLINLYALRAKQTGYKYPPDTPWQIEMEDAFPYTETEDQLKAIAAIKSDMESVKLMDRLICGDAGFGKTEVVIRAVFKAVMEGKQTAILVPTTVLAQQHYNTFADRFAPYPIRIGLLSRFRTAREQKEVCQKLKIGEVDLVIGTHRLLQKDIQFKSLGLLVIDEEQRFGVSHKEKLKMMRKDLDIISMSATPIPRTLHMALSGIRDISLIGTPPTNRKPVKTFVGEYKTSIIRNAILHELERGGQIFFVNNRIENIDSVAYEIQDLVPEANVRIAHGQMNEKELENVMFDFINGEFNVLVCTTIIETGLDISNANTIIINHANTFGLSQLYQLRGRVGRSDLQAYAYLLYHPDKEISGTAKERLKAIRELTNLGAGYQISIRDMEIRGVGNVFGAEQHGQMLSVGFDLYCKILSDTLEELKGTMQVDAEDKVTAIDIKMNAYFPETWISDKKQRMNEYKRLSMSRNEGQIDTLMNEWQDRFGKIPYEAMNLIEIARLKIFATKEEIRSINQEGDTIRISSKLRLQQWLTVQRQLTPFLQSRVTFKSGAVGARNSDAVILFKAGGMETEERLQALREIIQLQSKIG